MKKVRKVRIHTAGSKMKKSTRLRIWSLSNILLMGLATIVVISGFLLIKPAQADIGITGFGMMGDSSTDEYRADDSRGGAYAATTFNWLELLVRNRDLNVGPWSDTTRGEPRRKGYAFNWARSSATAGTNDSHNFITQAQHTSLAQQVAAGQVSHAMLMIGANDFTKWNNTYREIYDGTLNNDQVNAKVNFMVSNITTAIDTVRNAGDVKLVVATIGDIGNTPNYIEDFPVASQRQRVTNAIIAVNTGIKQMATARNIPVFDLYNFGNSLLGQVDAQGNLHIGGELISLVSDGDEPHHFVLSDHVHGGTVTNGLLANAITSIFNNVHGTNIPPFSETEMLQNAGINPVITLTPTTAASPTPSPVTNSPTPTDTAAPTSTPTLIPTSIPLTTTPTQIPTTIPTLSPVPTLTPLPIPTITPNPVTTIFDVSSYSIMTGSMAGGNLSSLRNDDNNYFSIKSTSGLTRRTSTIFSFQNINSTGLKSMTATVRLKSSTSGTNTTFDVYNFSTNTWQQMSSVSVGTSETTRLINFPTNLSQYINSGNQVGIRVSSSKFSFSYYTVRYDLVKLNTTN